jgi:hypothetical protein
MTEDLKDTKRTVLWIIFVLIGAGYYCVCFLVGNHMPVRGASGDVPFGFRSFLYRSHEALEHEFVPGEYSPCRS